MIIMPNNPDGQTRDLPYTVTTMWYESDKQCPKDASHEIKGSSRRYYCYDCDVWWWREGYGPANKEVSNERR